MPYDLTLYGVFAFLTKEESNKTQFVQSLDHYNDEGKLAELYEKHADHLQKWDFCALTQDEKSIVDEKHLVYSYVDPCQPGENHKDYFVKNIKFVLERCQTVVDLVNQGENSAARDDIYTKILTGNYDEGGKIIKGLDGRVYDLAMCETEKFLLGMAYLECSDEERLFSDIRLHTI